MKKWTHVIAAALVTISLTAGCAAKSAQTPAAGGAASADASTANQPVKNNEITVYTALEDDQIKSYLESYKKKYPDMKVNIVRDSTGVITAKLLAEKANPVADVVWGTAATSLLVLSQNDMLEPYAPQGADKVVPEFKDTANPPKWVGIDAWETAFIVNTKELEKKHLPVPKSYADLIKPEYKGMIVMPHPASSGTGFLDVSGWIQLMGTDKAWGYMDKLHENIASYVHSGSKPAKMAASGEAAIGISFGYRGLQEKKKGAPVEVVFPEEGSGWDVEANALMKKKDIKPEAKQFLDWAISEEPMQEYAKNYAILSVKGDGKIPEGYTQDPLKQLIQYDLNAAAKDRESILSDWEKRYSGKSEPKS
ncbi:putative 2-aminoethylphosphonate ABC transporter substrate-binding protein [Paenibacillus doosanensis]|uniref:Binding protein component of ABC iron transporter n=1 Tax=Paenibacillus konkukensis TaxID=2020716 RepID=A0ABY4RU56_9BACL|nr:MULTISPECIES: putative 2-aminoethylphosphonate ABC transporter substrate-binding protein [Paenibacillus]MCS7460959.1 putative 2-aminoethylphosphonate ABC transporter substrate-binding protein [Paenibacillus doosanensis]UQZ85628.1 putative binding protein component of ABC iron transporter precursor [Paenibacillus konkukensis]